jgi:glutamate dehydrogenase
MPRRPAKPRALGAIASNARALARGKKLPIEPGRFVRHYYAQAEPADLSADPRMLAAAALGHLEFAARRSPRAAKVRVFNPTVERDGWTSDRTIVEMVNDDMPFLVDSSTLTLTALGHSIYVTIHPIVQAQRSRGRLAAVKVGQKTDANAKRESLIHIEIQRETDALVLDKSRKALLKALRDVRMAVTDWTAMRRALASATEELRKSSFKDRNLLAQSCALLDWLSNNHFTLLGYREYVLKPGADGDELRIRPGTGLGLLRADSRMGGAVTLTGGARAAARAPTPLVITKANARSTVHRPALLDHIGVKVFGRDGVPRKERRFIGLFTSIAYNESPRDIPLLHHKVAAVMARSGLDPDSHAGKTLQHILDTFPRDELFQASIEELAETSAGVLALQDRHKVKLFCRREPFGRFFSCLVYLPRDHYSARARRRIEQLLFARLGGSSVESEIAISESALARLVVTVHVDPAETMRPDVGAIEKDIAEAIRTWPDRFRSALLSRLPEEQALDVFHRFAEHFSAAYQEAVEPERASTDVSAVARVYDGESSLELALSPATATGDPLRLTTFTPITPIPLHTALPILENMGFKVVSERPYSVRLPDHPVWIQDFDLATAGAQALASAAAGERVKECFARALQGDAENDTFNNLVLSAGLDWREAALLRAYCKYILQSNIPFSQDYMRATLGRFPDFCRAFVEQFRTSFDPDLGADERARRHAASARIIARELDKTVSLDDDRILRVFASALAATLRTSIFIDTNPLRPYVAFKFDSRRLDELPKPRPMFEIFVYSQRVEGVHLRAGRIARGGLRWSDRLEDYRTEVLGLMQAQQVKNSVIVPAGAKGGFVCKQLPVGDREAVQREVVACYQTFVRGLLSLTDNIVDGKPVRPARVLARDAEDPYLVVAADKGTAAFSDIANALSAEYAFWLGDAFASGGSAGYDHKKMGITARGAWESVKRHFRELGIDTQNTPLTVAGIGDMSGDVFGNGVLMSPHIKLVAAFDHRHIFIDPDPDPAASFAERRRMFRLLRSSWDDYDRTKLSTGGGIYSRQLKSIELSPAAQTLLGLAARNVSPPELIRAVLKAPVDLLWNGGIGTYVKASHQVHSEARDPGNDALRVDGKELRCRVVGEGGNLGFTQLGRIEYALGGGRINTDFIDNAGGVNSSDREVNIKILLGAALERRQLAPNKRNALLASMTDEIAALVLRDNYTQTLALSIMASQAAERLGEHVRLIRALEAQGLLDRALEGLPTDDLIEERRAADRGLTRPELAIVLSYSKIDLRSRLLASLVPEDPYLASELVAYFPRKLAPRYKRLMHSHKLAREIIAMQIASSIVNRMGPFFMVRAEEETGADVTQVARAYAIVREVFGVRKLWREIEALDNVVRAKAQYDAIFQISRMVRRAVYWFLQNHADALEIEPMITRFRRGAEHAFAAKLVTGPVRERFERHIADLRNSGFTEDLARRVASLDFTTQTLDIIELAREFKLSVKEIGLLYFDLAQKLRLDWVRERIEELKVEGRWRAMARASLRETLGRQLRALVRSVLRRRGARGPRAALAAWLEKSQPQVAHVQRAFDDMQIAGATDFATLSVALNEVGQLV